MTEELFEKLMEARDTATQFVDALKRANSVAVHKNPLLGILLETQIESAVRIQNKMERIATLAEELRHKQ